MKIEDCKVGMLVKAHTVFGNPASVKCKVQYQILSVDRTGVELLVVKSKNKKHVGLSMGSDPYYLEPV